MSEQGDHIDFAQGHACFIASVILSKICTRYYILACINTFANYEKLKEGGET